MRESRINRGMMSLFDAMLFFVIMLIASGLFLHVGITMAESADLMREQRVADYNDRARLALMSSSIPDAYFTHNGAKYTRSNATVQQLLIEELYLIDALRIPADLINFSDRVQVQANLLIDRIYDWAIRAESGTTSITITKEGVIHNMDAPTFKNSLGRGMAEDKTNTSYNIYSSTWKTYGFDNTSQVTMSLYLWPAC